VLIYYFTLDIVLGLECWYSTVLIWLRSHPDSRAPGRIAFASFHWRLDPAARRHVFEGRKPACRQPVPDLRRADFLCAELFFALGYNPKRTRLCRRGCACAQPPDEKLSRVFLWMKRF